MSLFEPRRKTVRIYGGDYHARLEELERRIYRAGEASDGRSVTLDETPEHVALIEEYNALVDEAAQHRVDVVVQQIPRSLSKELRKQNPPRVAGVDGATEREARNDAALGVNEETFREALVPASVVEPELSADDFDAMSEGAFTRLYNAALEVTYGYVSDPKEMSLVSRPTPQSDETSS